MAKNRYAKKVQKQNAQLANQAANALKDMSSYLNEGIDNAGEIQEISLKQIIINEANDYRQLDDITDIEILADDIERNGLLHNLVVSKRKNGDYVILSGERRYRALNMLMEREMEKQAKGDTTADIGKYRHVPCRVISNLTERKEQIILDAANLQTRGGAGDEKLTRFAMERYRDNVKEEYSLTEEQARDLLLKITNIGRSSIFRNFKIIDNLIPQLKDRLNSDEITKKEADVFLKLTQEEQNNVDRAILLFNELYSNDSEDYPKKKKEVIDRLLQAAEEKTEKACDDSLREIIRDIENIKKEESEKKEVTVKVAEKLSYRDKVIKECDDIQKKVSKLKKKKVDKIREIDLASENEDETILKHIDRIIEELQQFRKEISEGE